MDGRNVALFLDGRRTIGVPSFLRPTTGEQGQAVDHLGEKLKEMVATRCVDGDGLIPFLDCRRLETHRSRPRFAIRDGPQTDGLSMKRGFMGGGLSLKFTGNAMTLS